MGTQNHFFHPLRRRLSLQTLESRWLLATVGGPIDSDTHWQRIDSPFEVTDTITIQPSATLRIDSGVEVLFPPDTGIVVQGRIIAEGTSTDRIRFDRLENRDWLGIAFRNTQQANRITYTDMLHGDDQGEAIRVDRSRLTLDHITWQGTEGTILELSRPALIVRNSRFPTSEGGEIIHGEHIRGNDYLIIEQNRFANSNNGGDVIDFLGAERPGPVVEIRNNVFMGGGDDGLDLDGTDAHIEGNVFMNFRNNTERNTTSNAIAAGLPQSGEDNRTEITVVRNIFINNDHGLLLKEDSFATLQHNVFVDSQIAAIQFNEIEGTAVLGAGKGAYLESNIFWNNNRLFTNLIDEPEFRTELTIDHSLLPNEPVDFGGTSIPAHELGENNREGDPLFLDPDTLDFRIEPTSPARRAGASGMDIGAMVRGGPHVNVTRQGDTITAKVDGPGIVTYRYRLGEQPWQPEQAISKPIVISILAAQEDRLDVIAKDTAGQWHLPRGAAFDRHDPEIVYPRRVAKNETVPIVQMMRDWQGKLDTTLTTVSSLEADDQTASVPIYHGVGSASITVPAAVDQLVVRTSDTSRVLPITNVADDTPVATHSGQLTRDLLWTAEQEHHISSDVTLPRGSVLTIAAGARVSLAQRVNVRIEGDLVIEGTPDNPVWFKPLNETSAWGGIEVVGGTGRIQHAFFTGGGGDARKEFGHSNSQPVIKAERATLDCSFCYVIDNEGKAFGSIASEVQIHDSVISRVDTGGEFSASVVDVNRTHLIDIPRASSEFIDDDNDGFYFVGVHASSEPSHFRNSFVSNTKDDGLDHNGARLVVQNAWIENAIHEGIAASNAEWVQIDNSVFMGNNQGVEAGYGGPSIDVQNSVLTNNRNAIDRSTPVTAGLRFGDGYDGRLGAYTGHIDASELVLFDNGDNLRNFDGSIPGPQPDAIEITTSLANDPDASAADGNLNGLPLFSSTMHLLRGSVGFADGANGLPLGRRIPPISITLPPSADFNLDGIVSADDIDQLCQSIGNPTNQPKHDLNQDDVVDQDDLDTMVRDILNTTYGDANLDGIFDSKDLIQVFQAGLYETGANNARWSTGDWDCDGAFGSQDLIRAFQG